MTVSISGAITVLAYAALGLALAWNAVFWSAILRRVPTDLMAPWLAPFAALLAVVYAIMAVLYGLLGDDVGSGTQAGLSVLMGYVAWLLWNRNRGLRDRVKKWLGAKSKALRDRITEKIRELKPKPALRPSPQPV